MDMEKVEETAIPTLKTALGLISGIGVGRIVSGAVELVAPQTSTTGKIAVYVAKFGISSAISMVVDKNNNANIDHVVKAVKTSVEKNAEK